MNYQQVFGLVAVCALVMIPLGALLATVYRWASIRVRSVLPPRYLKPLGVRRRSDKGFSGGGR